LLHDPRRRGVAGEKNSPRRQGLRTSDIRSKPWPSRVGAGSRGPGLWLLVAVAAAAVPASATGTAPTAAIPAGTAPTAAGTAPAASVLAGLGLVDGQAPASDLLAVESGDGLVAPLGHLDEAEAA